MSLEISFKLTMSANFKVDVSDIESALDESPRDYTILCEHIGDSSDFVSNHMVPAFRRMLDSGNYDLEQIGDGFGQATFNTGADWRDYVDDEFIKNIGIDELYEQLHEAINDAHWDEAQRLMSILKDKA